LQNSGKAKIQEKDIHISTAFIHKKEVALINSFEYDGLQEDSFLINKKTKKKGEKT